jgi:hypothetical protein
MPFSLDRLTYANWPNCYRLSDGRVEVIATTDVGPRLIRFGFVGGPNEFVEIAGDLGQVGGHAFRLYGGHRFWHAPEHLVRSYLPDNAPVAVEQLPNGLRLTPPAEPATHLQKELEVALRAGSGRVRVTHRLHNRGLWPVTMAPWGLSAMAPGGTAIVPLPPRGSHADNLLPVSSLVAWAYTDLADPRWTWGTRHVLLRSQPGAATPQKLGAMVPDGWLAYARAGHLFVKRFEVRPGQAYPDFGSQAEIFTDHRMLELETLGPLASLAPGAAVEHVEEWQLFDGVPEVRTEAGAEAMRWLVEPAE